ncbi:MAG: TRAP transporter large permease subunit [Verrucomicrobiota bacterium]
MNPETMALLMFAFVLGALFSGYPVAFCLGGSALLFGALGVQMGFFTWNYLGAFFDRSYGILSNGILVAIPFFIFMGLVLEKSRLAENLLTTVGQLFGRCRGGIAMGVVLVGTLLAAATGVVGASVVAMGAISLPVMLRYGYRKEMATGVIVASGTLGQIIPPSIVLIVLADQIGTSVGSLFRGALLPGLLLAGLFLLYVAVRSWIQPAVAPALPAEERDLPPSQLLKKTLVVLLPPLALILIVLGSIFAGLATPTEAGALGAVGAMGLVFLAGRFTRGLLKEVMAGTARLTSMILFLLIGSTAFALVFRGFDGDLWIENLLTQLPGGMIGALIIANLAIFLLGFFIDFFEIAFIVVPLLAPVFVLRFGCDPAWFGIMVAMNLQTSFLTPPFGFSLFYLKGVCPPEVKTTHLYRGVLPFILIQLVALFLVILFPGLVTWMNR